MFSVVLRRSALAAKQLCRINQTKALSASVGAKKLFTENHEWLSVSGASGTVGISDHAQKALGDVVFVELPEVGSSCEQDDQVGAVESVKAVSDVYSPVSGKITAVNDDLASTPGLINRSCYEDGWLYKLTLTKTEELEGLMDRSQYDEFLKTADEY